MALAFSTETMRVRPYSTDPFHDLVRARALAARTHTHTTASTRYVACAYERMRRGLRCHAQFVGIGALYFVIGCFPIIQRLLTLLVMEKERRIKEAMKMARRGAQDARFIAKLTGPPHTHTHGLLWYRWAQAAPRGLWRGTSPTS